MPFLFLGGSRATTASAVLTGLALLGVGATTARVTGRSPVAAALRQFAIGASAAIVTYAIGLALGVSVVG